MAAGGREGIRREDCPTKMAAAYPGKQSKNNPGGSVLTKDEFIGEAIENWVRHFNNSDKYHQTYFTKKACYLEFHLKHLKVTYKKVKEILMKVGFKLAKETEDEPLTQSQNLLSNDMDVETEAATDNEDADDILSRRDKEQDIARMQNMTDKELFVDGQEVPENVKRSQKYIARHKQYVESYMDENFDQASSQEILLKLSQTPKVVQRSETYKERLRHLSFQEKSQRLVMKNIQETLTELGKTPEGRKQSKLFIAGVSHPVFVDPGLGLDERARKEIKQIKENLLKGETSTLKAEPHKKRSEFPPRLEAIARNHWLENTIPEPAKHSGKALEEDGETVPTRYQDKTDQEFYMNFKEECGDLVKAEMTKASNEMIEKLNRRAESADKTRRLEYAQQLSTRLVILYCIFILDVNFETHLLGFLEYSGMLIEDHGRQSHFVITRQHCVTSVKLPRLTSQPL